MMRSIVTRIPYPRGRAHGLDDGVRRIATSGLFPYPSERPSGPVESSASATCAAAAGASWSAVHAQPGVAARPFALGGATRSGGY